MECAIIGINDKSVTLIKPQTFMNNSGAIIPSLLKQGIKAENILVVHDELEKPFGTVALKQGGSHKGHNGLRSIMALCGQNFGRLRCGIGRPHKKEDVPQYVLTNFTEKTEAVELMINSAVEMIEKLI